MSSNNEFSQLRSPMQYDADTGGGGIGNGEGGYKP